METSEIETQNQKVLAKSLIAAVVLVGGGIVAVLNSTILTPIFPVIMSEMNVEATTVQWLASLFMLVNAVVVPMTAYVMGRFNVRNLFAAAMIFLAAGSLLCTWAPNFAMLLAGRAVQAVASGILMPLIVTVLMLLFPANKRGTVMGVYTLSVSVAPAVGPVLIGALSDTLGWRPVFVAIAILAVAFLLVGNFLIQKTVAGKACTLDAASVVLSVVPLLCLLYGFSSLSSGNYALVGVLIVVGVVGLALFCRRQLQMEVPYLDVKVLASRNFAVGTAVGTLGNAALTMLTVVLPLYLQNACGATATTSGLAVAPVALGAAIISLIAGKLHDVLGARKTTLVCSAIMTLGAVLLLTCNCDTPVVLAAVFATVLGIGAMGAVVPMNTWAINALPNELISHGNAVGSTLRQAASSLATGLAVTIMALGSNAFAGATPEATVLAGVIAAFAFLTVVCVAALVVTAIMVRD